MCVACSLCALNNANITITHWPQTRRWFLTLHSIVQTQRKWVCKFIPVGTIAIHSQGFSGPLDCHTEWGVQHFTKNPALTTLTSNVSLKPAMHSLGYISNYSVTMQTVLCTVLLLRLMLLGSSTGGAKHLVSDWNSCYHRQTFWHADTQSERVALHRHARTHTHTNMQNTAPKYTFKENCDAFVHLWLTGWQFIFIVWQAGL